MIMYDDDWHTKYDHELVLHFQKNFVHWSKTSFTSQLDAINAGIYWQTDV